MTELLKILEKEYNVTTKGDKYKYGSLYASRIPQPYGFLDIVWFKNTPWGEAMDLYKNRNCYLTYYPDDREGCFWLQIL